MEFSGEVVGDADARPPRRLRPVDRLVEDRAVAADVIQAQAEVQRRAAGAPLILHVGGRAAVVTLHVVAVRDAIVRHAVVLVDVEARRPVRLVLAAHAAALDLGAELERVAAELLRVLGQRRLQLVAVAVRVVLAAAAAACRCWCRRRR